MLPRRVTMDSASRNFQYRVFNNIVYFNEQLFKMNLSDNPYCSFCKSSYENVIHVFSECNIIEKIWSKLREWLSPELNLPVLTPQNAILGILAKDAPFDLLINHILICSNKDYISAETQTFHQTSIILRKKSDLYKR